MSAQLACGIRGSAYRYPCGRSIACVPSFALSLFPCRRRCAVVHYADPVLHAGASIPAPTSTSATLGGNVAAFCSRPNCRASDLAARIGGEEFVLLLPGADREAACAVAERVRAEIAARDFTGIAAGIRVTLSAGVAVDNGRGDTSHLLRDADAALYRAKGEGRDRVCA